MSLISPINCPYYLVSRLTLAITSALKRRLSEDGLSQVKPAYLWALMSLWLKDGLKITDIARAAGLDTSTMTGLLDRMERDGLVTRTADAADRRTLRIFLTDEGKRLREPLISATTQVLDNFFGTVPEDELELTKKTLVGVLGSAHTEGA